MKECEEENELLNPLVKMLKYQEYYEWILKKDVKDSHLVLNKHDGMYWYHEGVVENTPSVVMELSMNAVIEADVDSHELLRVNGKEVSGIEHKQVLNLNDDGERWEGDVLNNQPYGWGVVYDSENRMAYEGFRIGSVNVCYGTQYYSDIGVIEYKGEWCGGKRWGKGVHYDRNEVVLLDGEWMNDEHLSKRVVLSEENRLLHNRIEELIVDNNSGNGKEWKEFSLSFMPNLRLLEVGKNCFRNMNEVKLIDLSKLERVVIKENCFTKHIVDWPINNPNRHFYLKNCERVRELKIDNVPSLEVIEMGELDKSSVNFYNASLELKSDSQRMK